MTSHSSSIYDWSLLAYSTADGCDWMAERVTKKKKILAEKQKNWKRLGTEQTALTRVRCKWDAALREAVRAQFLHRGEAEKDRRIARRLSGCGTELHWCAALSEPEQVSCGSFFLLKKKKKKKARAHQLVPIRSDGFNTRRQQRRRRGKRSDQVQVQTEKEKKIQAQR